ncbi:MAG TPA: hypothetical protein VFV08_12955 [Puia sp.]|nr:hypothetical protein [Puia sp.]
MELRHNWVSDPNVVSAFAWTGVVAGGSINAGSIYANNVSSVPGDIWIASVEITTTTSAASGTFCPRGTLNTGFGVVPFTPTSWSLAAGQTKRFYSSPITIPATGADGLRFYMTSTITDSSVKIAKVMVERGSNQGAYFDGGSVSADPAYLYSWQGAANQSASVYSLITSYEYRRNIIPNPAVEGAVAVWSTWQGTGGTATTTLVTADGVQRSSFIRATWTVACTAPSGGIFWNSVTLAVVAGVTYTYSAWVRCSIPVSVTAQHQWYNTGTPTTGGVGVPVAIPANTWTRVSTTATCPAGSNNIQPRFYITLGIPQIGTTFDLDGGMLEASPTLNPYFDGNTYQTNMTLTASWTGAIDNSASIISANNATPNELRRNRVKNPNFETDVAGWGSLAGLAAPTRSTVGPYSGLGRISALGNNTSVAPRVYTNPYIQGMKPGKAYTLSGRIKQIGTWPTGGNLYTALRFQTGGSEVIVVDTRTYAPDGSGWMYTYITGIAPANCDGRIQLNFGFANLSGNLQAAGEFALDEVLLEESGSLGAYFDGSTPSPIGLSYQWTGAINASESVLVNPSQSWSLKDQQMYDLYNAGYSDGSFRDRMMAQLTDLGYTTGSITDRERQRLVTKTGKTIGTLYDLYIAANEKPRLFAGDR